MEINLYIFIIIAFLIFYYIFLKFYEYKINQIENKIKNLFLERSSLIPSVFEVSKTFLTKHNEIFNEILNLKKIEFAQSNNNLSLFEMMNNNSLIHHEINFIFRISNKHPQLIKQAEFIYLRNFIIKKSNLIWKNLLIYKKTSKNLNQLIFYKNITIIWLLLPINKKIMIY